VVKVQTPLLHVPIGTLKWWSSASKVTVPLEDSIADRAASAGCTLLRVIIKIVMTVAALVKKF
jgi:hypothetical protein